MDFVVECDGYSGLVLMDQSYLSEMDSELVYSMEYLLDYYGKTELVFDFPTEPWENVRERESKAIKSFCNEGKMIVKMLAGGNHDYNFQMAEELCGSLKWLYLPTGSLLAVCADELIQCVSYPDLEMEKVFELQLEKGWYAISFVGEGKILCCCKIPPIPPFENIQQLGEY